MLAKAAIGHGDGKFSIEEIEVHEPQGDEVLVAIKASGVCHTDFDTLFRGRMVLGHEGAGVVQAVGPQVTSVKPGDSVLLNWAIPCGKCFQCLEGNQNICTGGVTGQGPDKAVEKHAAPSRTLFQGKPITRSFNIGTMSSLTVVREPAVVKMVVDIPFPSASIIGCGVMTGYGSVVNAAKVKPGSSVAVLGTGGVGLNVIQGARIAGATKIIAVDVNPVRLEMAVEFGATHTLLADREDKGLVAVSLKVKEMTSGHGADYAFECTAIPELGAAPLAMVRNAGMAVQVSGIEQEITIDMNLFEWDKIYINPLYGKCRPQIDFPILQELYKKGDLILDKMVTRTYPLEGLAQAFDDMHHGRNAKGVLVFE